MLSRIRILWMGLLVAGLAAGVSAEDGAGELEDCNIFLPPNIGITLPLGAELPSKPETPDETEYEIWGRAGLSLAGNVEATIFYGLAFSLFLENYTEVDLAGVHLGWDSALNRVEGVHLALFCYAKEHAVSQLSIFGQTGNLTGLQGAIAVNHADKAAGAQLAAAASNGDVVDGVQLSGFANTALKINGLQMALVNCVGNLTDVVSGIDGTFQPLDGHGGGNLYNTLNGMQLSGAGNFSDTVNGAQFSGIVNAALVVSGLQVAPVNLAEESHALQLGVFNSCSMGGVQIGVFNRQTGAGWQFGLLNYAPGGWLPWMPLVNYSN